MKLIALENGIFHHEGKETVYLQFWRCLYTNMHNTETSGLDIISIYCTLLQKLEPYFRYVFSFGKLLKELKNIHFTMDNQMFYFNASGNFMNGYDLINWQPQEASGQRWFVVVENYNLTKKEVHIKAPIIWSNSRNTVIITNYKTHQLYMESHNILKICIPS